MHAVRTDRLHKGWFWVVYENKNVGIKTKLVDPSIHVRWKIYSGTADKKEKIYLELKKTNPNPNSNRNSNWKSKTILYMTFKLWTLRCVTVMVTTFFE